MENVTPTRLVGFHDFAVLEFAQRLEQTARVTTDTVGAFRGAAVECDFHGSSGLRTIVRCADSNQNVPPRADGIFRRYGRDIRDYYEDLWQRLPAELEPPLLERRLAFLRGEVRAGDRALDVGCGTGEFTAALADAGADVVGVDVAEAALERARARHPALDFRLVPFDGPLPFDESSFDVVWASEVIEHVADTARWLSEVRRVLAPGGRLLLTTPSHGRLLLAFSGIERFSEPLGDHLHLYSKRSLLTLLREFGFGRVEVRAVDGPPLLRRSLFARAQR
ncbi:MAG TPA: class I SAM-dependent methyltransferase [Solirubrobacteraceae bacterium]